MSTRHKHHRQTKPPPPPPTGPCAHALQPPQAYADLAKQAQRMRLRVDAIPTNTILALRSLWAFVPSQLDFIASGVAVPPEHIEDLAVQTRAFYRHVLGLPCWVSRALMSLPPPLRGPGLPPLAPAHCVPPPPHLRASHLLPEPAGPRVSPVPQLH